MKPRYRCLEDYATYYTNMINMNGQEDKSLPLVGEYFDYSTEGGFTSTPCIYSRDSMCAILMIRFHRTTTIQ